VPCVSFSPESERGRYRGVRHSVAMSAIFRAPLTDTPTRTPCGSIKQNDPGHLAGVFALSNDLLRHHDAGPAPNRCQAAIDGETSGSGRWDKERVSESSRRRPARK
jgi:hypothetical protein